MEEIYHFTMAIQRQQKEDNFYRPQQSSMLRNKLATLGKFQVGLCRLVQDTKFNKMFCGHSRTMLPISLTCFIYICCKLSWKSRNLSHMSHLYLLQAFMETTKPYLWVSYVFVVNFHGNQGDVVKMWKKTKKSQFQKTSQIRVELKLWVQVFNKFN